MRVLDAGALCAGVSRFGGSVASACFAVAAFSSRGARARRWRSLCWRRESLRRLGGFGVLGRRRLRRLHRARASYGVCPQHALHSVCIEHAPHGVCTFSTRPMASALSAHASRRLHSARASWRLRRASPHGVCTCLSRTRWRSEIALVALQVAPALATGRKQVPASSCAVERTHQHRR